MKVKKLFAILILGVFLLTIVPLASASIFDYKRSIDTSKNGYYEFNDGHRIGYGNSEINKLWKTYSPIEIKTWLGKTKIQIALTEHTEICGSDNTCMSKMEIYLAEDGVLIEDNKFYTLQLNGEWIEQDIRWSRFQYFNEGAWIDYNLGDEVKSGNYEVQLLGEKKQSRTVDWRIETQGKVIEELAIWGAEWIWNNGSTDTTNDPDSFNNVENAFDENNSTSASRPNPNPNANDVFYLGKTFSSQKIKGFFYKTGYTYSTPNADSTIFTLKLQSYNGSTWSDVSTLETGGEGSNTYDDYYNFNDTTQGLRLSFSFNADNPNDATYTAYAYTIEYETQSEAYVILNSPIDNYISDTNLITFNTTANVTSGATLTNMSLWTNESGNWEASKSKNITAETIVSSPSTKSASGWDSGNNPQSHGSTSILNKNVSYVESDVNMVGTGSQRQNEHFIRFTYSDDSTNDSSIYTSPQGLSYSVANRIFTNPDNSKLVKTVTYYANSIGLNAGLSRDTSFSNIDVYAYDFVLNSSIQTFNQIVVDGIIWNVQACDTDGDCGFAATNYSLFIDTNAPSIDLITPNETLDYIKEGATLYLTGFANDTNLDTCWYDYNNTNTTFSCTTETLFNETFTQGDKTQLNLTAYANDSVGNENSQTTIWDYKVWENSRTLNNQTFETKSETFEIDLTANTSLTEVTLLYDVVEYETTKSGTTYSTTLDVPTGAGNNSVRWKLTYAGDTIYTDYSYQQVNESILTLCNATYADNYLNITFKDESTTSTVNGTIQSSIFTHYLGSGTVNKTYIYSTTGNASTYSFCSNTNESLKVLPYVNYLGDGYPNRIWEPELKTYTTNATEQILYMLSSTDGIYVTFVTATSFNSAISGVDIKISRTIGEDTTIVSQGVTDSAGSFTAWLNPNYDHQIVATKTGYATNTQTIRPTQTSYTLVMSTGASEYTYLSDYEGLKWFVFPGVGIRNSTESTEFGFNITARNGNLINCKIELLNQEKTLVLADAISASANGTSCEVKVAHNMSSIYPKVKGRLLVDVGNGYQLLEDDAYWVYLTVDSTGMTFTDWFNSMSTLELTYFNGDEQHREYTYILIFFLVVMIICAVLNQSGWDIQNSGGMIFLVGTLVWIASVPGFLTLNYISPFSWMDKYFVAGVYSLFMIGYATRSFN